MNDMLNFRYKRILYVCKIITLCTETRYIVCFLNRTKHSDVNKH